jgi:hypothetical protein
MLALATRKVLGRLRRSLPAWAQPEPFSPDFSPADLGIIRSIQPYTMTTVERVFALMQAVQYVVNARIPGSIVECGVWRGGSMMAVAKTLVQMGQMDRDLYLFDTFEGMTKPGAVDVSFTGEPAAAQYEHARRAASDDSHSDWCYAPLADVRRNMLSTGYNAQHVHFVKGKVEDTIPAAAPDTIALLRLDTDWYASTHHELTHLYPRLSVGGVLIIDDYGYWEGSRRATDDYFRQLGSPIYLARIDHSARVAVKVGREDK